MTPYNRRRLLRDLGLLSASLAAPWPLACRCTECSDLYLILEGPWVLSIAHPLYMRAITARVNGHQYDYFDPRVQADPGCHRGINDCRRAQLDVRPHCNKLSPASDRNRLFNAMYDQDQGIFYTSDVSCPDLFDCLQNALELLLSYPDEIVPLGLHDGIKFNNLDCVRSGNVALWPSALLLRYKRWESAIFFGDGCESEFLDPGSRQTHRKISSVFPSAHHPWSPQNCASVNEASQNAVKHFSAVMGLLQAKSKQLPVPAFPPCSGDGQVKDKITQKNYGPVTEDELGAIYPPPPRAIELVSSLAGIGGVVGHG